MTSQEESYRSWQGVSQAIKTEASRAAKAGESALTVTEQIVQANHDRFLSRVFADGDESEWLLKGGTAMLARVPRSRATKDLDLASTTAADLDAAQEALVQAASRDLGDHVRFQLATAKETGRGENQPGVQTRRLVFTGQDASTGRRLFDVPIDVVVGPPPVGTVETTEPSNRILLGRPLPTHPYRLFPIADQIAEKVTATMSTYAGRPSSRVKDLVDMVTIARTQTVNLRELQMAIDAKRALSHLEPFSEFTAPAEWERTYRPLAAKTHAVGDITTLSEATGLVRLLVNPALADERVDEQLNWSPADSDWTTASPVLPAATEANQGEVPVRSHIRNGHAVRQHSRGARNS